MGNQLVLHTVGNVEEFKNRINSIKSDFDAKNYKNAGNDIGSLIHFTIFWEIQSQNTLTMLENFSMSPAQAAQFLDGLNIGFSYFNNLPDQKKCVFDTSSLTQDA